MVERQLWPRLANIAQEPATNQGKVGASLTQKASQGHKLNNVSAHQLPILVMQGLIVGIQYLL